MNLIGVFVSETEGILFYHTYIQCFDDYRDFPGNCERCKECDFHHHHRGSYYPCSLFYDQPWEYHNLTGIYLKYGAEFFVTVNKSYWKESYYSRVYHLASINEVISNGPKFEIFYDERNGDGTITFINTTTKDSEVTSRFSVVTGKFFFFLT